MTKGYLESWYADTSHPEIILPQGTVLIKMLVYRPETATGLIAPNGKPLSHKHKLYPLARVYDQNQSLYDEATVYSHVAMLPYPIVTLKKTEQYKRWEDAQKDQRPKTPAPPMLEGLLIEWQNRYMMNLNPFEEPEGDGLFTFIIPVNLIRGWMSYETVLKCFENKKTLSEV